MVNWNFIEPEFLVALHHETHPISSYKMNPGNWLYDFGQKEGDCSGNNGMAALA